jgi:serine/threonine protein kinase
MMPVPWKQWEGQVVDLCFPLRRYLGSTGRSAVYLTQYGDSELRNAAIKLVLADTPEADPTVQWERAAKLSHPHVLRLLRTGRWQVNQSALRYAVTEYAEENLAEVLAERPLTAAEARDMLKPLLDALAYIHGEGLVHGHLKPANIMAVGDELKLSVDGITLVGEPGAAPGTPGPYDPPEFRGRGCSPAGDIWSFGVTLVEALTQQLPVLDAPKQEPVLPETLPAEFLPIVRACLRPDPRRRASIDNIVALFAGPVPLVATAAVLSRPAAPRNWTSTVLVCASAVALAGILAGPRLLHRPEASAKTEPVAVGPASASVPAPSGAPGAVAPGSASVQAPSGASGAVAPAPASVPAPSGASGTVAPASAPVPAPSEASRAVEAAPAEVKPSPMPPPVESRPVTPPPPATITHPAARTVESSSSQVVRQVMPNIPDYARRTIRGMVKIQVRATVGPDGHVSDAKVESQNSKYFAKLSLEAARRWEFAAVPGDWVLRFEFTPTESTVHPSRVGR